LPVSKSLEVARKINLAGREEIIAGRIVHEIRERLQFLDAVGLGYISLDRSASGWPHRLAPNFAASYMSSTSPQSDCIIVIMIVC
jgi:hypothetical protein